MSKQSAGSTKVWVLALTSIGSLMVVLDAMVVATALSTMRVELDASLETLQWTMNAYNLSFAVLLMTGAALGDRFGRRRTLVAGLALFIAASVACALAGNAGLLIAARAVQGAGAAMVMPLAMALLSVAFPPEERGKALGIFSSITGLALIIGPMAGGAISEGLSWHWIFWLNVPVGIVLIPLVMRRIPESHGPGTAIDVLGVALVTAAAFGVVWGLMRGNIVGWSSSEVLSALTAGLLLAIAFVLWQLRTREPMLPLRFFQARAFSSGVGANFLLCAAIVRPRIPAAAVSAVCPEPWAARGRHGIAALDRHAFRGRTDRRQPDQPRRRALACRGRIDPASGWNGLAGADRST